jgi:hypothetical protein
VKHIKFWTKAGGGITAKQGVFGQIAGKQGKQNQTCVTFGKTADTTITGGGDGAIYIWIQTTLTKKIDRAHQGPLFVITTVQDKVGQHEIRTNDPYPYHFFSFRAMQQVEKMGKLFFGIWI